MDVLTPEQRRLNMSRNRGRNSKPEVTLRSALHRAGLRFRIHRKDLPGNPDIVFPSARLAVFVDGCFWHSCPVHGAKPATNKEFWQSKLAANRRRDDAADTALDASRWNVLRVWEHEVREDLAATVERVKRALKESKLA